MGCDRHQLRVRPACFLVVAVLALLVCLGPVPGDDGSAHAAPSPAIFTVRVDARGLGTFTVRGALADQGRAVVRRAVVGGRLNATETLTGARGRIVLTSQSRCGGGTGTWRVVSGTLAYAALRARGTTTGLVCKRSAGPATFVHRGSVELPPAPLADPGAYGGWTTQDTAILFEVTADGRSIAKVLFGGFRYDCLRSDGLRIPAVPGGDSTFAGPFPIADDGSFSFKGGQLTIAGRFTSPGARGTVAIDVTYPPDAQGRTTTCKASVGWTATMPPPPPKRALAGTYCGFILGGGGVCVDVAADGRQVRGVRAESHLTCGIVAKIPVTVPIASDQPVPLFTDLSFRASFTQQFEGITIRPGISGTFDRNGGLTGVVGTGQVTITRDGAQHVCRGNGNFTARLQR